MKDNTKNLNEISKYRLEEIQARTTEPMYRMLYKLRNRKEKKMVQKEVDKFVETVQYIEHFLIISLNDKAKHETWVYDDLYKSCHSLWNDEMIKVSNMQFKFIEPNEKYFSNVWKPVEDKDNLQYIIKMVVVSKLS